MPSIRPRRAATVAALCTALALSLAPTEHARAAGIGVIPDQFSLTPASPELPASGLTGADIIGPWCVFGAVVPCAAAFPGWPALIGLAPPPADQNVTGLSLGGAVATTFPPPLGNELRVRYSIELGSAGADPLVVAEVADDGAAEDIWEIYIDELGAVFFGIGIQGSPPPIAAGATLGLTPSASDVDAWVDVTELGNWQHFYTVDPATAAANGLASSSIYRDMIFPFGQVEYADAAALGLDPGDHIDAIDVTPNAWDAFDNGETVYFSLSPDSPSLTDVTSPLFGASPADIFAVTAGGAPYVWATAAQLYLDLADNIDALQVYDPGALNHVVPLAGGWGLLALLLLIIAGGFYMARRTPGD